MPYGILGPTQVIRPDGSMAPVGGAGLRALLARLLVDAGRLVGTDRLIQDLYGDRPPARAGNALQSQVSRLRRALPEPAALEFHPAGYRLAVPPGEVDAHRFTTLAGDGHRALAAGAYPDAARLLTDALGLWRGAALADVVAPFAAAQAALLDERRLVAIEDRAQVALALGAPAPVLPELREVVAAQPLRESVRALLMRALAATGRQAEALAEYEDARHRLAEELGIDPSPELVEVHRAVLRGAGSPPAVPGRTAAGAPGRATTGQVAPVGAGWAGPPAQLTSFVGREEDLRRVGKLLGEARLVTLTGPGGAGKTRLAVEAAAQQSGEVGFVPLAPLVDGAEVPQAVLAALGLREAGLRGGQWAPPDPVERLVAALADRPALLLLDNCEHVIDAVARLTGRLLAALPALRVLATSREPLGLTGEALWPLSGLGGEAAARLFRDRAADVAPAAILDDEQVSAVCQTLDGLPLAIELAAARLRTLPAAELVARLDDRFRLLTRGSRTAEPRHQTLAAVVSWSWDLLAPAEQALARRLTVFTGDVDRVVVAEVCGFPVEVAEDLLASLVDKSLVEVSGGRFRMLETIRAFAGQRLAEAGEADRFRAAHAAQFLSLAQRADPHLRRADQLAWLSRLDADRDNLHLALRRAAAGGDPATALRLVAALAFYWWLRGLQGEGAVLAAEALAALSSPPPPELVEEHALAVLVASMAGAGGPAAERTVAAAATVYTIDRPLRHPFLYFLSGVVAGPPEPGPETLVELLESGTLNHGDDPWVRALGPLGIALVWAWAGDLPMAERQAVVALTRFRELGDRWGMTMALSALAEIAATQGAAPERADLPMAEALRLAGELDSSVDVADLLRVRGQGRLRAGDLAGAEDDYRQGESLAGRAGALDLRAACQLGLAQVAKARGEPAAAGRLAEAALATCPTGWFSAEETRAALFLLLGEVAEAQGRPEAARTAYQRVLDVTVAGRPRSSAPAARAALDRLRPPPD